MATYKAVVLTGANQVKADGTANVKIRITHNRKVAYIPTDLYVIPGHFDNSSGQAVKGDNTDHINLSIAEKIFKIRKNDVKIGDLKQLLSVTVLKKMVQNENNGVASVDLESFILHLVNITDNKGTANSYTDLLKSLKKFKDGPIPFTSVNINFLVNYERFLKNSGVKNGINNYMRAFRSVFNKARDYYNDEDAGVIKIPNYPFRKYKIPKPVVNSKLHVLSVDELKQFVSYKTLNAGEQFAKDMFLLMFFLIGIEAKDLFYLDKPVSGRVQYKRFKTGGLFSVKMEPEAVEIINRYKGEKYLLNVNQRFEYHKSFYKYINNYLHGDKSHNITGIFERLKINKKVTTKWARHTWATIARNECGISKTDVALSLGHKDIENRVTDIYIKDDYRIIDKTNSMVIDMINAQNQPGR